MKTTFMTIAAGLAATLATAQQQAPQQLPKEILYSYPAAVITKVYETSRVVPLNNDQLLKLADTYRREDSLLFTLAVKNASLNDLDKVRKDQQQVVTGIIGQRKADILNAVAQIRQGAPDSSANAYMQRRIQQLQAIQPLDSKAQEKLQKQFQKELTLHPDEGWATNFNEAMNRAITDTVYYARLYKTDIQQIAESNTNRYLHNLVKGKKITKAGREAIYPLVYEQQWKLATIDKAYPNFTKAKDSLINNVYQQYDSLIAAKQKRFGAALAASQLTTLLQYRTKLQLSETQVDSIIALSATIQRIKDETTAQDPLNKYDSKPLESQTLARILTDEQFAQAMFLNFKSKAEQEARQDWKELETAGLTASYSKDSTLQQLQGYYLARASAGYRYSYDKEKQKANVRLIDDKMPAALRALKASRKYNNPGNTPQGQFQW